MASDLLPFGRARRAAREAGRALPVVEVSLHDAVGSVLAAPLVAATPLPPFDASAMEPEMARHRSANPQEPLVAFGRALLWIPSCMRALTVDLLQLVGELALGADVPERAEGG